MGRGEKWGKVKGLDGEMGKGNVRLWVKEWGEKVKIREGRREEGRMREETRKRR